MVKRSLFPSASEIAERQDMMAILPAGHQSRATVVVGLCSDRQVSPLRQKNRATRIFSPDGIAGIKNSAYLCTRIGGLAQLARALAWHARGHQFDPGILHNPGKDGHKSILIFLSESVPCIHKYPPLSSCSDRAQTGRGTIRIRTKPRAGSARAKKTAIGRKKNAITSNTGQ